MTNAEKFKTADERARAFKEWCHKQDVECIKCKLFSRNESIRCRFAWLDLEAEEEKPLPCPFCGGATKVIGAVSYHVTCTDCMYCSDISTDKGSIIAAHNRVARAVGAGQKDEK